MPIVFVFLRAFLKSAKIFSCCYSLSEPPFSKHTCFYDKNNPPTPQRQASGLRAKGSSDKENTRPMPSPGKYPTCHTRIYHNQELGVATPTCPLTCQKLSNLLYTDFYSSTPTTSYYKLLRRGSNCEHLPTRVEQLLRGIITDCIYQKLSNTLARQSFANTKHHATQQCPF